jgi:hypothetical protein
VQHDPLEVSWYQFQLTDSFDWWASPHLSLAAQLEQNGNQRLSRMRLTPRRRVHSKSLSRRGWMFNEACLPGTKAWTYRDTKASSSLVPQPSLHICNHLMEGAEDIKILNARDGAYSVHDGEFAGRRILRISEKPLDYSACPPRDVTPASLVDTSLLATR